MDSNIPVVDCRDFLSEDAGRREKFVETVGEALIDIGFFAVSHHGIDRDLIAVAYRKAEEFFLLPTETKKKYERVELQGQRAFISFGREHAKNSSYPDLKEFWHVGREEFNPQFPPTRYGANLWPDEVLGFRKTFVELYTQLENCARQLLEACALFLEEPQLSFSRMTENADSILRIIHYPPVQERTSSIRAAAHEDINLITLLCEATDAGLELLDRNGRWRAIHALKGQIIVDAGDMLQNLTNGIYKSTTHRVVNPSDVVSRRFSMPFFCHARAECDVGPLASCVAKKGERLYPTITSGAYLTQRLNELGL